MPFIVTPIGAVMADEALLRTRCHRQAVAADAREGEVPAPVSKPGPAKVGTGHKRGARTGSSARLAKARAP